MTEPDASGIALPRWPRDRWISPTTLNTYGNCPYRVRLTHIDKVPPPPVYNVFLSKGRIAHDILRDIANMLARGYPLIDETGILKRARIRLPWQEFPSGDEREAHARQILDWVTFGMRYLERIPDPSWLLIEKNLHREWAIYPKNGPYTVMARPDVVVQRLYDDDLPLIEIIDYKTGKVRPEPGPPVLMRFVFRDLLKEIVGIPSDANVRFTYLWLDTGERTHLDLTLEYCHDHWTSISQQLHDLASETEWKPTPSFLCNYCPYYENVCTEQIPPSEHDRF